MGLELALGLTISLFRSAVYQRETKGLKVYNLLNKFAITPAASSKLESLAQDSSRGNGSDDLG